MVVSLVPAVIILITVPVGIPVATANNPVLKFALLGTVIVRLPAVPEAFKINGILVEVKSLEKTLNSKGEANVNLPPSDPLARF